MGLIKHGKGVPHSVNQVIRLFRKSGTTFKGINQHTQESHASHCDITHAKWHHFYMNYSALMTCNATARRSSMTCTTGVRGE